MYKYIDRLCIYVYIYILIYTNVDTYVYIYMHIKYYLIIVKQNIYINLRHRIVYLSV